jgi:DNA-binding transcriptional LysR family regulator
MVASDLKSGALVSVLAEYMPFEFSVDALYPHRRYVSAKVRYFIEVLGKHFRASLSPPQQEYAPTPKMVGP